MPCVIRSEFDGGRTRVFVEAKEKGEKKRNARAVNHRLDRLPDFSSRVEIAWEEGREEVRFLFRGPPAPSGEAEKGGEKRGELRRGVRNHTERYPEPSISSSEIEGSKKKEGPIPEAHIIRHARELSLCSCAKGEKGGRRE